jgi:hypothetical protein
MVPLVEIELPSAFALPVSTHIHALAARAGEYSPLAYHLGERDRCSAERL